MGFYSYGSSWRIGNALLSSSLDFFILDSHFVPVCYTEGASVCLPSFLPKDNTSRLTFISDAKVTFISYIKTRLKKDDVASIEKTLNTFSQKNITIEIAKENSTDILNLTLSKIEDGNILVLIKKQKKEKKV